MAPGQFEELFDGALREDLASSEDKKLLVFVSTGEADSVCATRILQVRVEGMRARISDQLCCSRDDFWALSSHESQAPAHPCMGLKGIECGAAECLA